jgi:D-alanine-D-alanine ligase
MKKKVGIFMGGYSPEWEISMQSGLTVFNNLNTEEFDRYKVIINRNSWTVSEGVHSWPLKKDTLTFIKEGTEVHFDVIFNAIHGHPGEDGYMQALFEMNNIPHSSCGFFESALTFNKSKTNELLKSQGIVVPKARFYTDTKSIDPKEVASFFGLPLFIKPNRSGSSFGVTRVNDEKSILPAIQAALKEDNQVIIEEAILGTELGCGVACINGKTEAIATTEIVSKKEFFDYEAKYLGASEEITPARIDAEVEKLIFKQSEKIYNYLGLWGVIRADYIVRDNIPYLIEVNSIPGLSPASIIPQQLAHRNWALPAFFGGLLHESIERNQNK